MGIKNTMEKAWPNLIFDNIATNCTELVVTPEGWKFWKHTDPYGYVTNVQFCKLIGRKQDVFECINDGEWRNCPHNRFGVPVGAGR